MKTLDLQIKLSVCFITYNHVNYVRQALDSVLMQQTDFDFEIVIGDDCSTDGTSQIIQEYLLLYPDRIRINPIDSNKGMVANWISTIQACKGTYIAMLEGDDYWTDPEKLKKQVHFLEKESDIVLVAHDVEVLREAGAQATDSLNHPPFDHHFMLNDLVNKQIFLQTASMVFRSSALPSFPRWVDSRVKSIDYVVYLMLLNQGKGHYLAQTMSTYRLHAAGISHVNWVVQQNRFEWDMLFILTQFTKGASAANQQALNTKIETLLLTLVKNNAPESKDHRKALLQLTRRNPRKYADLAKGYVIQRWVPKWLYNLYQKRK